MTDQFTTPPESPGLYLERKFMVPNGLSQNKLARDLDVTPARLCEIIRNRRSITADTALRLAKYFKTPARFWLELQLEYDLYKARMKSEAVINMSVRNNPLI
ncbi:MAG: HigA family addiction module antidote protein [Candidatus Paracaedimonas acanthamoebae]|uniref:HigA family addiction module antidote protein n=1 Tax=Candidatus Paracaedimonas acanthamoebae TaxID=244581 RepID=A0A8J7Q1W0_9PROT|nr:HigA family addiction module antidote protein [Holosporales bacterium]MBN9413583.1 HigA family addiction module antidote protein [Candidatus Paracaedimonas acanthamoebae]OJX02556.1 MAG: addiction module antidote protein, HigA family [Caedibacter sp. 38-128]